MIRKFQISEDIYIASKKYSIVGIDHYCLQNHLGEVKKWISYTLVGNSERIGLSEMDGAFTLWKTVAEPASIEKINLGMSGIANITFEGDRGPSTPLAELTWFSALGDNSEVFLIERFLKSDGSGNMDASIFYQVGTPIPFEQINFTIPNQIQANQLVFNKYLAL